MLGVIYDRCGYILLSFAFSFFLVTATSRDFDREERLARFSPLNTSGEDHRCELCCRNWQENRAKCERVISTAVNGLIFLGVVAICVVYCSRLTRSTTTGVQQSLVDFEDSSDINNIQPPLLDLSLPAAETMNLVHMAGANNIANNKQITANLLRLVQYALCRRKEACGVFTEFSNFNSQGSETESCCDVMYAPPKRTDFADVGAEVIMVVIFKSCSPFIWGEETNANSERSFVRNSNITYYDMPEWRVQPLSETPTITRYSGRRREDGKQRRYQKANGKKVEKAKKNRSGNPNRNLSDSARRAKPLKINWTAFEQQPWHFSTPKRETKATQTDHEPVQSETTYLGAEREEEQDKRLLRMELARCRARQAIDVKMIDELRKKLAEKTVQNERLNEELASLEEKLGRGLLEKRSLLEQLARRDKDSGIERNCGAYSGNGVWSSGEVTEEIHSHKASNCRHSAEIHAAPPSMCASRDGTSSSETRESSTNIAAEVTAVKVDGTSNTNLHEFSPAARDNHINTEGNSPLLDEAASDVTAEESIAIDATGSGADKTDVDAHSASNANGFSQNENASRVTDSDKNGEANASALTTSGYVLAGDGKSNAGTQNEAKSGNGQVSSYTTVFATQDGADNDATVNSPPADHLSRNPSLSERRNEVSDACNSAEVNAPPVDGGASSGVVQNITCVVTTANNVSLNAEDTRSLPTNTRSAGRETTAQSDGPSNVNQKQDLACNGAHKNGHVSYTDVGNDAQYAACNNGQGNSSLCATPTGSTDQRTVSNHYKILLMVICRRLQPDDIPKFKEWAGRYVSLASHDNLWQVFVKLDAEKIISVANLTALRQFFIEIFRADLAHIIDYFNRGDYTYLDKATLSGEITSPLGIFDERVVVHDQPTRRNETSSQPVANLQRRPFITTETEPGDNDDSSEQNYAGSNGEKHSKLQPRDSSDEEDEEIWLCNHYKRRCKSKFTCCNRYWACHRCHNEKSKCGKSKLKALDTAYLKCLECGTEQKMSENAQFCINCNTKFAKYFCPVCKHLTGTDDDPYHCHKCGICRIHKNRSFHCDVCGVCLDVQLEGNHKCRPDSAHDVCGICLEDAFSGCQILPCSHKVHKECAAEMIRKGIRNCPVCRASFAHKLVKPGQANHKHVRSTR